MYEHLIITIQEGGSFIFCNKIFKHKNVTFQLKNRMLYNTLFPILNNDCLHFYFIVIVYSKNYFSAY